MCVTPTPLPLRFASAKFLKRSRFLLAVEKRFWG